MKVVKTVDVLQDTWPVTIASTSQTSRDRALGRGASTLIPQSATASPADQAAAALAALRTVVVHVGVLQAAAVLLEETARTAGDESSRAAARHTVALLRAAMHLEETAAIDSPWFAVPVTDPS
ncbi:hypothetical protein ACIQ7Q_33735 [Streptomyces sp. NPDC096176]|uniref:hypothetical protein n=1 Tax=Streptomyces sp. NPDC096176 TaxID=3366079 RepID=UPI0038250F44